MQLYTVYYISVNCSLYTFWSSCPNGSMTTEGSRDGLTSARCCI